VTGVGKLTVTPVGAAPFQPAVRLTVEPKPSTDDSVIVADCEEAGANENDAGEGWLMVEVIAKSGDTGARTDGVPAIVTTISLVCVITPLDAVIARV